MRRVIILLIALLCTRVIPTKGQAADSLPQNKDLEPVEIIAWFNPQPLLGLTASAQTLSANKIETQQSITLLPALNTIAGVRMEERSPGSYRIAMRGSLIRSPFGIRNIKMYLDEFPLTDAGGNTYMNIIDPGSVNVVHIIKGPDGSIYGANSGGVIRIQPKGFNIVQNQGSLLLSGGSYGLFQEQLSIQRKVNSDYTFSFDQSFVRSDGYRENSGLNKKTLQTSHKWQYSLKNQLRILVSYTNLDYRTPGGLTSQQLKENPAMARPASGGNHSAAEQKAGVHNKTLFFGIVHQASLAHKFSHSVSLSGSYTDFENPFITNFEIRKEKNIALRTWFSFKDTIGSYFTLQMHLGFEGQKGFYRIENYDNEYGVPTLLQAMDNINNTLNSFFYRTVFNFCQRWTIEASLGSNHALINYKQHFPVANPDGAISFGNIWMPRIAASCILFKGSAVRGSVSKGYSLPAIAEVRSSDNIINTDLQAETGINYEVGLRYETSDRRYIADLSFYIYNIGNGIVRQIRENGAEYFLNAGEIKQKGLELFVSAYLLQFQENRFIRTLSYEFTLTYNHYRFGKYTVDNNDFTDNKVTAVPDFVWTSTMLITFPGQTRLNISHIYTSSMPLNDANTVFSEKFHLVQVKGIMNLKVTRLMQVQLFAGTDNLLNQIYSLGNDINAFGDRYFNPAPPRNYYGGIKVIF